MGDSGVWHRLQERGEGKGSHGLVRGVAGFIRISGQILQVVIHLTDPAFDQGLEDLVRNLISDDGFGRPNHRACGIETS